MFDRKRRKNGLTSTGDKTVNLLLKRNFPRRSCRTFVAGCRSPGVPHNSSALPEIKKKNHPNPTNNYPCVPPRGGRRGLCAPQERQKSGGNEVCSGAPRKLGEAKEAARKPPAILSLSGKAISTSDARLTGSANRLFLAPEARTPCNLDPRKDSFTGTDEMTPTAEKESHGQLARTRTREKLVKAGRKGNTKAAASPG